MRYPFAAICLTPVALLAAPAAAATIIGSATTAPVRTSTAANGSTDDVQISSSGSVTAATPAVTVDSNNNVDNEGTIQITDVNNAVGILVQPGRSANITNGATITVDEAFTATDTNGDGIIDPPFASGSGRYAIHALGPLTGNILNSGTITVKGNDSAGIALDGPLTGALTSSGSIIVTGNNGFGIHAGEVSDAVSLGAGAVSVIGQGSIGVALDGNVGGQVTFQGGVTATGFSTTASGATNSADLLVGGPAVRIQGNVGGGLLFAASPLVASTTDTDVNKDGIADAGEGIAAITSMGRAPAVQIGSATSPVTIGALAVGAANGAGILNEGSIAGSGLDAGFSATGMQIGGLGGTVKVAGGLANAGSISASSFDSNATALRIAGDLGTIANSGSINASGSPLAATGAVQAISIDAGGRVLSIANTGIIAARNSGSIGIATAIADRSGLLGLVQNSGQIIAGSTGGTAIAIDLGANATGATVRQVAPSSGSTIPTITGNVLFGGGANLLDVEAGTFTGNVLFGAGTVAMVLAGGAQATGNVDFGGGTGSLVLNDAAALHGALAGSGGIAVAVNSGTLDLTNAGTVQLGSLSIGSQGAFTVNVDGAAGTHSLYQVAGQASFAPGAKVNLRLQSIGGSEGSFVILDAGSLSGAAQLTSVGGVVPFLFETGLVVDQANGDIALQVRRKTAAEIGLNRSESAMFTAAAQALDKDAAVAGTFLSAQDAATLQSAFRQLLPDHAGAVFQAVSQSARAEMRVLTDPLSPLIDMGGWGLLLQQVGWGDSKGAGNSDSYRIVGWGAQAGPEFRLGPIGNVGLTLSYLAGSEKNGAGANQIVNNEYELAGHWRARWNGLSAFARASAGYLTFDGTRYFSASDGSATVSRTAKARWTGMAVTAAGGLSYEARAGAFSLRPAASVDFVRLRENGYSETGGGDAFDLNVASRTTREEGVNSTLTLGYDLARAHDADAAFVRLEMEGGRRDLIGRGSGATVAHFAGGADFTLLPDQQASGWLGRLRLLGGNSLFQIGGELSAERQQGHEAVAIRAGLQTRF
ncbi:MAG: hypothetical protein QOH81_2816 [Sphingomonadales bacterium]|jgi:hypothetical protein|nr:hypothetical protein [Sphingomonadales bacterium]